MVIIITLAVACCCTFCCPAMFVRYVCAGVCVVVNFPRVCDFQSARIHNLKPIPVPLTDNTEQACSPYTPTFRLGLSEVVHIVFFVTTSVASVVVM